MEVSSVSVRDEAKERNSDDLSGGIGQAAPESSRQPVGNLRPRLLDTGRILPSGIIWESRLFKASSLVKNQTHYQPG